jgi:hypothetical protein
MVYFSEFDDYAINPLFNEETLLSSILHNCTTAHPAERNPDGHHCITVSRPDRYRELSGLHHNIAFLN